MKISIKSVWTNRLKNSVRQSAIMPKSIRNTTSQAKLTSISIEKGVPEWYQDGCQNHEDINNQRLGQIVFYV